MRPSRLQLTALVLLAGIAFVGGAFLLPAPEVGALPPFVCLQERTTAVVGGQGPTCAAALQDAEAKASALVPCGGETCLEEFEVTQSCLGEIICSPSSCHELHFLAGRMHYRCRVDIP